MKEKVIKFFKNCFWLSSEDGKNSKEIYVFNAMRFIAFFFIFAHHAKGYIHVPALHQAKLGVAFFIIISGFLNGYLKKDVEKINVKSIIKYTKRKMSKIYPLFLFVILITLPRAGLFNIRNWDGALDFLGKLVPGVTLTSSWINDEPHYFAFFAGIWYMSVFFFLIVMTPILMKIVSKIHDSKHGTAKLLVLAAVLYCLSMVWVFFLKREYFFTYIFPPARLFEYAIGMIFGSLMRTASPWRRIEKIKKQFTKKTLYTFFEIASISLVAISAVLATNLGNKYLPSFMSIYMNVFTIPVVLMLCVFVGQKGVLSYILSNKPMVLFGRAAMYLYLIHMPLLQLMNRKVAHNMSYGIFLLILTIIISVFLYSKSKKHENSSSGIQKRSN